MGIISFVVVVVIPPGKLYGVLAVLSAIELTKISGILRKKKKQ